MIQSFKGKLAEKVYLGFPTPRLAETVRRRAKMKLAHLDAANALEDLAIPPGNRLKKLAGDRADRFSIRVNDQWRICFLWKHGDAFDVELIDYH